MQKCYNVVGNHSHSQAQKSIEQRFNPQKATFNADDHKADRQQDIKIEDNFNEDANPDNEDDASDDEHAGSDSHKPFDAGKQLLSDRRRRLEHESPLRSDSRGKLGSAGCVYLFKTCRLTLLAANENEISLASSQNEIFADSLQHHEHSSRRSYDSPAQDKLKLPVGGSQQRRAEERKQGSPDKLLEDVAADDRKLAGSKHAKGQKRSQPAEPDLDADDSAGHTGGRDRHERSSRAHMHDKTDSNETGNDDGAKMNKICFGVFASISHEFILDHGRKADEISLSLQSAFRVISLTRPEYKIILKTLLKCEGIKHYEALGEHILDFVNTLKSIAPAGATDKQFSFTYHDVLTIVKSVACLTDLSWRGRKAKYAELRDTKLAGLDEYCRDFRSKTADDERKAEEEALIAAMERNDRIAVE